MPVGAWDITLVSPNKNKIRMLMAKSLKKLNLECSVLQVREFQ
jgi:hypothetical protein